MAYQAIYYDRSEKHYYLRDDISGWSYFKYHPTYYKLNPDGEFFTLFGDRVSPFKGKFNWEDPNIFEKDISKELLLLRDYYYKDDSIPSFHNIVYLDIEIEMLGALTPQTIRAAEAEITAIALTDNNIKQKICFVLDINKELENVDQGDKYIISCSTEVELLNKFLLKWQELDPTIVVGYNSDFFDIPYLYYRIRKVLGENKAVRLSPIEKINENLAQYDSPINIGGINCLDFMLLFKKYITKEEPSYKLGDIGTKYVGLGKIEYSGNLNTLFKEDKNKFIEYNLRDIEIIEALEEKLKFIQLTILISHLCHTPYESIYYNTILNEGAILTYLKRKNIVAPNKPTTVNPSIKEIEVGNEVSNQRGTPSIEGIVTSINGDQVQVTTSAGQTILRHINTIKKKQGYAGGYLLDPIPGLYNWLFDEDVTSYYPFSIITLNIGVETLKCRIKSENPNYETWCSLEELKEFPKEKKITIEKLDHKTYILKQTNISVGDLIKYIEENGWTVSANGVVYESNKKSITAELLEDWFVKRKIYKNKMKECHKKGDNIGYELNNQFQHSFKILLNSLYGAYAINGWRFSDGYKMCSSSITCTGQRMIKESIKFINEEIDKELS